jgi:hypothetical protein
MLGAGASNEITDTSGERVNIFHVKIDAIRILAGDHPSFR